MTDREIILALFNPMTKHNFGCLYHDPHIKPRGPCICGFAEVVGNYLAALRAAKEIASEHYGKDRVEKVVEFKEPPELAELTNGT